MLRRVDPFDRDEFGERMNVDPKTREEELMQRMNDLMNEKRHEVLEMTAER